MPGAIFVPYDGSRRAQQALARAVELCRDTSAHLGVAVCRRQIVGCGWPGPCAVSVITEQELSTDLLRRVPDDISLRFLGCTAPLGSRGIAELATRLECDTVVLPGRGIRTRAVARTLARSGFRVAGHSDNTYNLDTASSMYALSSERGVA